MQKIPTLYERVYEGHKIVGIKPVLHEGITQEMLNQAIPTEKFDGSCCCVLDGVFYKRFDAKRGRKIPEGAIPCCPPDPITGHHPHWVKVDISEPSPEDRWFVEAYKLTLCYFNSKPPLPDGTYEAIGKHFNGNPYHFDDTDILIPHGKHVLDISWDVSCAFDDIKQYLSNHYIEGIVFWLDGKPLCKIKRTDFGFEWNGKGKRG